ncbi:hypothetical protein BHM03_00062893 [Ensete ventricosum]|nr:hypothetical protein BHM03_00062893 [Ensete ventricosum]
MGEWDGATTRGTTPVRKFHFLGRCAAVRAARPAATPPRRGFPNRSAVLNLRSYREAVVLSTVKDLTTVDFDGDVNLAEKEVIVLSTAMSMNLKEEDRYVVNHGEGLILVDFDDHVNLAKKEGADMAKRRSGTGHA